MSKFDIFNKIKIDLDKYEEIEDNNNDELKKQMQYRLKFSKRSLEKKRKDKMKKGIIISAASLAIIIIGIGIKNPAVADGFKKRLPEFENMLDKLRYGVGDNEIEYDPALYTELENEKKELKKHQLVATKVDVFQKDDGMEMTIDKAMYNKKYLYLDMTLKCDKPFKETPYKTSITDSPYNDGEKYIDLELLDIYINKVKQENYGYSLARIQLINENTAKVQFLIDLDIKNDIEKADFKLDMSIKGEYGLAQLFKEVKAKYSFEFKIDAIDNNEKTISINKEDGGYKFESITVTDTYIQVKTKLPTKSTLGNPHNNFIIVTDDKGRELEMETSEEGEESIQIHQLIKVGEIPKYVDISVYKDTDGNRENALASVRVNIK